MKRGRICSDNSPPQGIVMRDSGCSLDHRDVYGSLLKGWERIHRVSISVAERGDAESYQIIAYDKKKKEKRQEEASVPC